MLNKLHNKLNYFGDNSVLHGVRHVFSIKEIHMFKRLFWLAALIGCGLGASLIMRAVLEVYGKSVSFSVETTYLDFHTPFPAVTVCEYPENQKVLRYFEAHPELSELVKAGLGAFYRDVAFWNKHFCKSCAGCQTNPAGCREDLDKMLADFRFKCTEMLTDCWWDGEKFPCCERFKPMQTDYGTCFSFNSRQTDNTSDILIVSAGHNPTLEINATEWIEIRLHSPDDVLSVLVEDILGEIERGISTKTDFEILLSVEEVKSDSSVLALPPSVRGCLMHWERPSFTSLWPFITYSTGNCQLLCRATAMIEQCNCTYHNGYKCGDVDICGVAGLACLNQHHKYIMEKKCDCPPECNELSYKLVHMFKERFQTAFNAPVTQSHGVVKLLQLPSMRVRRQVIRDRASLVVDVGGVGGVFFGASVLGVIEIFYLLFMRSN